MNLSTIASIANPHMQRELMTQKPQTRHGYREAQLLVQSAYSLARALGIRRILVQADERRDIQTIATYRQAETIIWVTRDRVELPLVDQHHDVVIRIPETPLTRTSQVRISLFLSLLNTGVELKERLVCLYAVAGSKHLDTLLTTTPKRNFPWLRHEDLVNLRKLPALRHFERLVEIALRLAAEGREGRPIGTTFVLGEPEPLAPYLSQLILNPCAGHPPHERDIHNPNFVETLRELAALDGAFVISNSGTVESAGTYLDAPIQSGTLRRGLGARHAAALAITAVTKSFAMVISESSGTVTVYHEGRIALELEKPEATPHHRSQSSRTGKRRDEPA
jgi:DNA integrity scanning protein DisA with diadenylate cyclase activity